MHQTRTLSARPNCLCPVVVSLRCARRVDPIVLNHYTGVTVRGNTITIVAGPTPSQLVSTARLTQRLASNGRTPLSPANFVLSGWGTGASVTGVSGFDQAARFTVNSGTATGITANPTMTLTFADLAWPNAPVCVASPGPPGSPPVGAPAFLSTSTSTTAVTVTYNGSPEASKTYLMQILCMGI
jgi:hypothetical protein